MVTESISPQLPPKTDYPPLDPSWDQILEYDTWNLSFSRSLAEDDRSWCARNKMGSPFPSPSVDSEHAIPRANDNLQGQPPPEEHPICPDPSALRHGCLGLLHLLITPAVVLICPVPICLPALLPPPIPMDPSFLIPGVLLEECSRAFPSLDPREGGHPSLCLRYHRHLLGFPPVPLLCHTAPG
jgi:hypothetical protein